MRLPRAAIILPVLLAAFLIARPAAGQPAPSAADEQTLKNAGLKSDPAALLEFFRKRTPGTVGHNEVQGLVKQLADPAARDRAAAELVSLGALAVPTLRQAANDFDDAEAAARARSCLQSIENGASLSNAAARLLGQARPAGAAEALLRYAPFAEDDQTVEELGRALGQAAVRDGKLDPALTAALKDDVPVRRALAGEVLSKSGLAEARDAVRYLLQDAKPSVRLRAALALAEARDAEAITVLIGLLGELPPAQTRQVEDFLVSFAGEWSVTTPQGADEVSRKMRREVWMAWWQATEGSVLLDEIRSRSLDDAAREKAEALIKKLADDNQQAREKAMTDLLALGGVVAPLVRQAAEGGDEKLAAQAQKCLQLLADKGALKPLPTAAPRLLAVRKPQGAVKALLDYLPFADDENVSAEVQAALAAVATRDGKSDPELVKALRDRVPLRRAVAAEVLAQTALDENRDALDKLLEDADLATVRTRAALALAGAGDKKAVPVLIALLTELPASEAVRVEDYLRYVAREQAPEATLTAEDAKPQKVRDAWAAWWAARPADFVLPRLDATGRLLGYTLLVEQYNPAKGTGRVVEVDQSGRVRWSIEGLQGPSDAQVVPGDKVLIVEMNINRVSEREIKGKVLWERQMPGQPIGVRRLANGNTFIASRNQLLELTRDGKEVFTYNRPNHDIMAATRLRDGTTAVLTYQWNYFRLDAAGKEIKTGRVPNFPFNVGPNAVEFLPNERFLVANAQQGKVMETDLNGKVTWEASIVQPFGVSRLPNGNTLVGCANAGRAVELDRAGKVVWEYKDNIRPAMVRRR